MKWASSDLIRTPTRQAHDPARYLVFARMASARNAGGGPACIEGHFDCAGWESGPCSNAIAVKHNLEGYEEETS